MPPIIAREACSAQSCAATAYSHRLARGSHFGAALVAGAGPPGMAGAPAPGRRQAGGTFDASSGGGPSGPKQPGPSIHSPSINSPSIDGARSNPRPRCIPASGREGVWKSRPHARGMRPEVSHLELLLLKGLAAGAGRHRLDDVDRAVGDVPHVLAGRGVVAHEPDAA